MIGLIGGATLLAKGSGVVWVFVGGLTLLWHAGRYWPESWPRLAQSAMVGGVALLVVWAMYGFEVGLLPDVPWPVPAPMHWYGVFYHADVSDAFRIFALGHIKEGHWWWYFPVAFCIKNPLPFVAGVIVSGYLLLSHRTFRRCWQDLGFVSSYLPHHCYNTGAEYRIPASVTDSPFSLRVVEWNYALRMA